MVRWLVKDEVEWIWTQVVLASRCTILEFAWRGWKRTRKSSARKAGDSTEINKSRTLPLYHLLGNCPSRFSSQVSGYRGYRSELRIMNGSKGKRTGALLGITFMRVVSWRHSQVNSLRYQPDTRRGRPQRRRLDTASKEIRSAPVANQTTTVRSSNLQPIHCKD